MDTEEPSIWKQAKFLKQEGQGTWFCSACFQLLLHVRDSARTKEIYIEIYGSSGRLASFVQSTTLEII